jgi:hypothetical protein
MFWPIWPSSGVTILVVRKLLCVFGFISCAVPCMGCCIRRWWAVVPVLLCVTVTIHVFPFKPLMTTYVKLTGSKMVILYNIFNGYKNWIVLELASRPICESHKNVRSTAEAFGHRDVRSLVLNILVIVDTGTVLRDTVYAERLLNRSAMQLWLVRM